MKNEATIQITENDEGVRCIAVTLLQPIRIDQAEKLTGPAAMAIHYLESFAPGFARRMAESVGETPYATFSIRLHP